MDGLIIEVPIMKMVHTKRKARVAVTTKKSKENLIIAAIDLTDSLLPE